VQKLYTDFLAAQIQIQDPDPYLFINFSIFTVFVCFFSPDFALAHVQKLYTDFLASQVQADRSKAHEVIQNFDKAVGRHYYH
jgi:hypothetical protein